MDKSIYLDYMATTPVAPEVVSQMMSCLDINGCFGNPASSSHLYGYDAAKKVVDAREQVANLIDADPADIIFTSGATEASNLAIKGACEFYQRKGRHIITMATEHKSVLESCGFLQQKGFEVTYLNPGADGLLDLALLEASLRPDTVLISIMYVNNETGVIQDIEAIGALARRHGILFHTDATQAVGKLKIDIAKLPIDMLSFSAHKLYGPKGIGALYVRSKPKLHLQAQIHGGGHQKGFRSGTLPTHQIVGMGAACELAKDRFDQDHTYIKQLRDFLWQEISRISNIHVNGHVEKRISGALSLCVPGVTSDTLILRTPLLAFSSGSACNAASSKPSHVLKAMGMSDADASSSIRLSVGRYSTLDEMKKVISILKKEIVYLREISPISV
jgi:cysteine desulfurase